MPSFSIVIPTRNRSELLAATIQSAVSQGDVEFELIISDNSTTDEHCGRARTLVEGISAKHQARYIRPPEPLNMPDHWEFATQNTVNDYVLILTDRMAMRPKTLQILVDLIGNTIVDQPPIVMWSGLSGLTPDGALVETQYEGRARIRKSRDVLAEFAANRQWKSDNTISANNLPRGLNSAVKRTVIEEIRRAVGRLYRPLSPDYTSAFLQLALAKEQLEIDLPLYASHGTSSNGHDTLKLGIAAYADQCKVDPFEHCPIDIDSVMNSTYRDYLYISSQVEQPFPPIDIPSYLLVNWREVQIKQAYGSRLDLDAMRRSILECAAALPAPQRRRFEDGRRLIDASDTRRWRLRNRLEQMGALSVVKRAAGTLGLFRPGPRYPDILSAIADNPLRWSGAQAAFAADAASTPHPFGASQ